MVNVTVWLAFLAGFLSFVSPCVLPLIPAYITYMGNRVTAEVSVGAVTRTNTFYEKPHVRYQMALHGIAFVVGFMFVFVVFGLAITAGTQRLSSSFYELQRVIIPHVGGILIILFGLHFIGLIAALLHRLESWSDLARLGKVGIYIRRGTGWLQSVLYADTRFQMTTRRSYGLLSSSMMGIIFAAGWTPCIGPIYGTILTMAVSGSSLPQAGGLMVMYSLGLGVPFIMTAVALDRTQGLLNRFKRHLRILKVVSGAFLIGIGVLVYTGDLQRISQFGATNSTFTYRLEECMISVASGNSPLGDLNKCMTTS